jgi:uncharacterized protein HemX
VTLPKKCLRIYGIIKYLVSFLEEEKDVKIKRMSKNNKNKIRGAAVSAGMAAIGAGAYYLLGPNSKAHQKKAKALVAKMKKEAESDFQKVKKVGTPIYHKYSKIVKKTVKKLKTSKKK